MKRFLLTALVLAMIFSLTTASLAGDRARGRRQGFGLGLGAVTLYNLFHYGRLSPIVPPYVNRPVIIYRDHLHPDYHPYYYYCPPRVIPGPRYPRVDFSPSIIVLNGLAYDVEVRSPGSDPILLRPGDEAHIPITAFDSRSQVVLTARILENEHVVGTAQRSFYISSSSGRDQIWHITYFQKLRSKNTCQSPKKEIAKNHPASQGAPKGRLRRN